jgi:hypothetical protein
MPRAAFRQRAVALHQERFKDKSKVKTQKAKVKAKNQSRVRHNERKKPNVKAKPPWRIEEEPLLLGVSTFAV